MRIPRSVWPAGLLAMAACAALASGAAAKGVGMEAAPGGVTVPGSPYRYVTIAPASGRKFTIVERIERDGGRVDRWWYLRGLYFVTAIDNRGTGGGLSADGGTLVLTRFNRGFPAARTSFAVLDTNDGAVSRFDLPTGLFPLSTISPDGSWAYLTHYFLGVAGTDDFEVRAVDLKTGRLSSKPIPVAGDRRRRLSGLATSRTTSADGRWAYTLYFGDRQELFLRALDTVAGRSVRMDLPELGSYSESIGLWLRLTASGRELDVLSPHELALPPLDLRHARPLLRIETRALTGSQTAPSGSGRRQESLHAITKTLPDRKYATSWRDVVGHSEQGSPIALRQFGDRSIAGKLLIFGCIHGDECAAREVRPLSTVTAFCPDPASNVYVVPNLNPDGAAHGSRTNGRGVDLNRNFPSEWRPIGGRWDPQYSGPRPFSEPESRLAARIIEALRPRATIWFHQHHGDRPFVRAWGQSAPAARHFAALARMPFHLLPWPAGTAPNWQNHRFPGTSSFVVELPWGEIEPAMESRLAKAAVRLGRAVSED